MTDDLHTRIASLLPDAAYADAVMAVVQPELDELKAAADGVGAALNQVWRDRNQLAGDVAQLKAELESLRAGTGRRRQQVRELRAELEDAQDVLRRIREVCDRWERYGTPDLRGYSQILRAVLDGQVAR